MSVDKSAPGVVITDELCKLVELLRERQRLKMDELSRSILVVVLCSSDTTVEALAAVDVGKVKEHTECNHSVHMGQSIMCDQ